ncbi:hypothetical protein C1X21_16520 [Pseudomonas sp. FW305-3-2-15-A-LB2]|nr:hypothetical protein C1X17_08005 [Pseudomonas sp. FW305-3-2-15-C-TSA2]PMV28608.1 hypothetical protein C1X22_13210 [Pseudomonas sp. DP16D-L5]PMV38101.1 hypothetical protein C1X21_16520 [Pseudomonas sp. FW305-3-2-15-A-LB2]PMV48811.1 hypothetical protein C1X16_03255 [Pseudomonas sp. FW305-3-2-15-C-R2A1]PMV53572.1 hypothetical protein C1X18_06690 [Pseudomonas sp. FW305-3-2-15-C-LB1]PMV57284.1 hypothetical protein C1X19_09485 [Pseudomonas sp. GW460-4]PMV64785.1 hypothetical protein C1X20_06570 
MQVYQDGAGIQFDTQSIKQCQNPGALFGIPNDTIRNIRLSERMPSRVVDDRKNHHKFHAVVVMFVTCQLAYILLYQYF